MLAKPTIKFPWKKLRSQAKVFFWNKLLSCVEFWSLRVLSANHWGFLIVLAHRRGSLLDSGDTEMNETYWPSTWGPRHGSSCIVDLQNTSSATDRLNLVKNLEVSQFLPCCLTPMPSAVSSTPCPTALFWGTGSLTPHECFVLACPRCRLALPRGHRFSQLVAAGAVLHAEQLKGTRGLCSLAPFAVGGLLLFQAKTRWACGSVVLRASASCLRGVLAPRFSSTWSRSSIQVTFHLCECGDLGLFYLFLYLGAPNSGWHIGSA